MQKSLTSYDILNIPEQATQDDIHAAYRRLVKTWHPDRHHSGNSERANRNFVLLQQAYQNIGTPERRSNYNQLLSKMKRTIMANQNKVMNDNSPIKNFFKALDTIFNPIDRKDT
jgi:DnaJ-class molecular chaperone